MGKNSKMLLTALVLLIFSNISGQDIYYPPATGDWETTAPESLGWCPEQIDLLYDYLETEETKSFLLLKDGKIVLERYFGSYTQDSLWPWFSAGKSLRATMVGIAQEQGFLDINDRTSDYLGTGWTSLPQDKEDLITVQNQLRMDAGLNEFFFDCITPDCLFYVADAGNRWAYHNGPYNLLKDVLEIATGSSQNALTNSWIEDPIGMGSGFWLNSGNNSFYLSRARDMARFGILIQGNGIWDTNTIINDTDYFNAMISPSQDINPSYGYLWWLNGQDSHMLPDGQDVYPGPLSPSAPEDLILAAGSQGQFISISREEGLLMIRQGTQSDPDFAAIELHNFIWDRIATLDCSLATTSYKTKPLILYPNPASHVLNLQIPKESVLERIQLMDSSGRVLKIVPDGTTSIALDLPQGMYFLTAFVNGTPISMPFSKS